jgi:soluble lytic murein transglycosylase-like protein
MRWANEERWSREIEAAASAHQLDPNLVRGLIAAESQFDPNAVGDDGASIGLMQVQVLTAASVGIQGDLTDPVTNLAAGTAYLAEQIAIAGGIDAGISAYNGGYRPQLGFGAPLPSGSFRNQAYVSRVKANWAYFRGIHPGPAPESSVLPTSGTMPLLIGALVAFAGFVAWLILK